MGWWPLRVPARVEDIVPKLYTIIQPTKVHYSIKATWPSGLRRQLQVLVRNRA